MNLTKLEILIDQYHTWLNKPYVKLIPIFLLCLLMSMCKTEADPDLFARLATGNFIFQNGFVPVQDPFAFTVKNSLWIDHEWLAGLVFFAAYNLSGYFGLIVLKIFLVILIFYFLMRAAELNREKLSLVAYFFLFLVCEYLWASTIRSQLFSYVILSYLLYAIAAYKSKKSIIPLIFFIPLQLIGVNSHGGGLLSYAFFGIFIVTEFFQSKKLEIRLVNVFMLSLLVALANPYGLQFWDYLLKAITMPRPGILEWDRLPWNQVYSWIYLFLTMLVLIMLLKSWRSKSLFIFIGTLFSIYEGWSHQRFTAIFFIFVFGTEPSLLISGLKQLKITICRLVNFNYQDLDLKLRRSFLIATFVLPVLCVMYAKNFPFLTFNSYPESAVKYLKDETGGGNLLVGFNAGSYAIWTLYPKFLVSMDGRYEEVYPQSTVDLVATALDFDNQAQSSAVEQIAPDYILTYCMSDSKSAILDWTVEFQGGKFCIYTRS